MLLNGAFLPPRSILEEVVAVVRSVEPPVAEPVPEPEARRLFGRRARAQEQPDVPTVGPEVLHPLAIEAMSLPITSFGNPTPTDVQRVTAAISEAAAGWHAPTLRFAGGTALDFPGDWNVWVKLAGEVDELAAIARGVTQAVEPLGLFVDRRKFRPMLAVGKVTAATTGPYLESLVAALEALDGTEWVADGVALTTIAPGARESIYTEYQRIPLTS